MLLTKSSCFLRFSISSTEASVTKSMALLTLLILASDTRRGVMNGNPTITGESLAELLL